jgi:glycine/serine hydroxymethyltransferase
MGGDEMRRLAGWIHDALSHHGDRDRLASIRAEVEATCRRFPVPGL